MVNDQINAQDSAYEGRAIVAAFADRESARNVRSRLHDEGFHHTWMGVTHPAETQSSTASLSGETHVDDVDDSIGAKIGRFFSGDSGDRSLYDSLIRHGVADREARRIDSSLEPNSVILTVDGSNHPEYAVELIESAGGHVLAGEAFSSADIEPSGAASSVAAAAEARSERTGSSVLGYGRAENYARGQQIDEDRRIQLRAERLNVDKQRVAAGEATIDKEVITTPQTVDVPVMHEELFVERRAVAESATPTGGAIGSGETIRIPLMREEVAVTKRPVVTGEFVVGKREITDTEHVSETTREERLRVAGVEQAGRDDASAIERG
jgi:uncharacterized protein (TIGR02271 family)